DTASAPPTPDPATTSQPTTQSPAVVRRNYWLGVANGVLFAIGESLSSPGLVLALLVRQLGGSLAIVGLLPALQSGGYLLPQLLVSGSIQAMPYKLWLYRRAAFVRVTVFIGLLIVVFNAASLPPQISLGLIVLSYGLFNLAGGTSTLAFQDVVAKIIPPRRRGSFFGLRQFAGGLLAFVIVGPLVGWLLGAASPVGFPANFGLLCLLGIIFMASGLLSFALVNEPPQTRPGPRMRVIDGLRRAPAILRGNSNYRWFIIARMLTRAGQIAEPFYIIYASEALGLPTSVAGLYLAVRIIAGALSNLLWSRLSDRSGNRMLVLVSAALAIVPPFLVLAGPALVRALALGSDGMLWALGLVFLAAGAANDGSMLAGNTYLLEVVPEDERPSYMGLANTTLGLVTFLPVLGGLLVAWLGYNGTFVIALAFALLGALASLRLTEVRILTN
ncbi:MAG: MFS transporter, partial [Roseiflexaceae bacterium]|nr:MFS transporter [Roseiflexaceae bacterium]